MILYQVVHVRVADHGDEEVTTTFEWLSQATYWAAELRMLGLPVWWEFEFIEAPKQYEFAF
jgi:hypothetical protein